MTTSTSPLSYRDCYDLMDKAIEDEAGIRVKFRDNDEANYFRMRCHQARKINREENLQTYPAGSPLHGRSPYDVLTLRIRLSQNEWWLYFERNTVDLSNVESLSGHDIPLIEAEPQKALAPPKPIVDDLAETPEPEDFRRRF